MSITGISAVDIESTVWQMSWVEVAWPTGDEVCSSDGSRIWFQTTITDITGSVTAWCNDKITLELSQRPDKDAFVAAHKDGDSLSPPLASTKLVPKPSGDRLHVVQGKDQSIHEAPTNTTLS